MGSVAVRPPWIAGRDDDIVIEPGAELRRRRAPDDADVPGAAAGAAADRAGRLGLRQRRAGDRRGAAWASRRSSGVELDPAAALGRARQRARQRRRGRGAGRRRDPRGAARPPTVVANLTLPLLTSVELHNQELWKSTLVASGVISAQADLAAGGLGRARLRRGRAARARRLGGARPGARVIRLAVRVPREHAELVLAELMVLAPGGMEEREAGEDDRVRALRRARRAAGARRRAGGGRRTARRRLHDRAARRGLAQLPPPVDVGDARLRLASLEYSPCGLALPRASYPSAVGTPLPGALDVVIEPGQAFGTGAHATTRLTLELLTAIEPDGRARRLGLRQRRAGDRRRQARLGARAGLRRRARVGRGDARGRRGQRRGGRGHALRRPPGRPARADRARQPRPPAPARGRGEPAARPRPPDHLRPRGRRARRGRARLRPPRPARGARRAGDNWSAIELHRLAARDHARRRPGRGEAARRGRAPDAGHHRPLARRGHRRRARAAEGREPAARGRLQVPRRVQRGRRAGRGRPRARRRDRLLGQPRPGALARRAAARGPGGDPDARRRAARQARRDARLRRRGRALRPLRRATARRCWPSWSPSAG